MPRPAPVFLALLVAWTLLGLAAAFGDFAVLWVVTGGLLFTTALLDALQVRSIPSVAVEREVPGSLALGVWQHVKLALHNSGRQGCRVTIFDGYPVSAELTDMPQTLDIPPRRKAVIQYRIRPEERGLHYFSEVQVLVHSPWRLWRHFRRLPPETAVRVYPNFAEVTKYVLLATENRLGALGIRKLQRRGEGLEFHQLREYRTGDSLRQLDWNATARQKKLISKEYQDERDQQVVFMIDCGRRMLARDGALSHFDHTLNAVLLLAYVALRQGDAVGLLTFSGPKRWLAPRKGMGIIKPVLNSVYDLQPSLKTSDYLNAAEAFIHHQRRRALVILVTNLRDEDSDELLPALQLLRRKHLVLLASLQERIINEVLEQPVKTLDNALRHAASLDYLQRRRQLHYAFHAHGILCLDTEPEQLPVKLVNRYLEIKRAGRL